MSIKIDMRYFVEDIGLLYFYVQSATFTALSLSNNTYFITLIALNGADKNSNSYIKLLENEDL